METARVVFGELGEPFAETFGDRYFSSEDGAGESLYAFLDGCDFDRRVADTRGRSFTVAELGFGTGLNFLLAWQRFDAVAKAGQRLHYWSVDRHPMTPEDLARALSRWPQLASRAAQLQRAYPPPVPGIHRRHFDGGRIVLDLVWSDAGEGLAELQDLADPTVDAWFLDGFAPRRNEQMWDDALFRAMATASRDGATVATYTSAGAVRRGLESAGFRMHKRPGFGRKRESLAGQLARRHPHERASTPWDLPANQGSSDPREVIVLGGGLAGAHLAASLARRGSTVTVLEAEEIAGRASGNPQGVLFNRLSPQRSALADFSLHANLYAVARYGEMFRDGALREPGDGSLAGCLQIGPQASRVTPEQLRSLPELARFPEAEESRALLGASPLSPGLWQENSGWLSPPAVCRALLDHPRITVREQCGPLAVEHRGTRWQIVNNRQRVIDETGTLLLACGVDTRAFGFTDSLPLSVVRGQTTQLPVPPGRALRASFCHHGYIAPALNGEHCIGATFQPKDEDRELRVADHAENLQRLAEALPEWAPYLHGLDPETLQGRAELRCVSPDYLPLAGPVPEPRSFGKCYGALRKDATRLLKERVDYLPGLYLSSGHGSRGLSYSALAAELIASQLWGEPAPLPREVQKALAPARFLHRSIIRGSFPESREHG